MASFNDDVQRMLSGAIGSFERERNARLRKEAEANPEKHKLTRLMQSGWSFLYYSGGRNGKSQRVYHCFTTKPNVAGYYLYFKEVHSADNKTVWRKGWKAFKTEGGADTHAMRCARKAKKR